MDLKASCFGRMSAARAVATSSFALFVAVFAQATVVYSSMGLWMNPAGTLTGTTPWGKPWMENNFYLQTGTEVILAGTERRVTRIEFFLYDRSIVPVNVHFLLNDGAAIGNTFRPSTEFYTGSFTATGVPFTFGTGTWPGGFSGFMLSVDLPYVLVPDHFTFLLDIPDNHLHDYTTPAAYTRYDPLIGQGPHIWALYDNHMIPAYYGKDYHGTGTDGNTNLVQTAAIHAVSGVPFQPTSYTILQGLNFGGNLASLLNSDDDKVYVLCDEFDSNGEIEFISTLPAGTVSQLKFKFEGSASRSDLSQFVRMFNYSTNTYTNVSFQNSTIVDSVVEGTITTGVANYYSGTREVKSRVFWIPQADIDASDGWSQSCDQVLWTMN